MANPFDNVGFSAVPNSAPANDVTQLLMQAKQNPAAFEAHIKATNPQAYQRALQIRNSGNPQAMIMEMAKARGINPNMLRMLGIL